MQTVTTVIGGNGRIGRRYCAILRKLSEPYRVYDPGYTRDATLPKSIEQAIICTPTDTHYAYVKQCLERKIPVLCEKPLSKVPSECDKLRDLYSRSNQRAWVVCNYRYIVKNFHKYRRARDVIFYDYFNPGSDDLLWDACQLIYLDKEAEIKTESPFWTLRVNDRLVSYAELENSYHQMIMDFVKEDGNKEHLWTIEDGYRMTKTVLWRLKREQRACRNPGEKQFEALPA